MTGQEIIQLEDDHCAEIAVTELLIHQKPVLNEGITNGAIDRSASFDKHDMSGFKAFRRMAQRYHGNTGKTAFTLSEGIYYIHAEFVDWIQGYIEKFA